MDRVESPSAAPDRDPPPALRLSVERSAYRYFETLEADDAVYFFWGVDGADSSSRWVAFALPQRRCRGSYSKAYVTEVYGVKIVVPEARRVPDLYGRTLTCQHGRLLVT